MFNGSRVLAIAVALMAIGASASQYPTFDMEMCTAFIDQVAAPIANKMFTCGMIP